MMNYIKTRRIFLCRIQALDKYDGSTTKFDRTKYNGCNERWNSEDCNGIIYGYVNTLDERNIHFSYSGENIHIERIDKNYNNKSFIPNCLVIFFTFKENNNDFKLVGYYKDAIVFRTMQYYNFDKNGKFRPYNIMCNTKDCVFFEESKRIDLNSMKKNSKDFNFGQSHYAYYDDENKNEVDNIINKLDKSNNN